MTNVSEQTPQSSVNWNGRLAYFLALPLLLMMFLLASPPADSIAMANVQPALLAMANEQPGTTVRVIAQKASAGTALTDLVAELNGSVVRDLHIIDAIVAKLPAGNVPQLAQANGVRWISLDGPVESAGKPACSKDCEPPAELPENTFLDTLNVRPLWDMGVDGSGVTIAVIDSGIASGEDFSDDPSLIDRKRKNRILDRIAFNDTVNENDNSGHGTHVAGIAAGNGGALGMYGGIAPQANLLSLSISNGEGMAYESDTVAALQWVLDNKDLFNIRVVNLSINAQSEQSYHTSPLDAAAEILWFNQIVVVVSAGNKGPGGGYNTINAAPANDPFLITVGASDERQTADPSDDNWASFSAHGITLDGHYKPEIIAPGKDIISVMASNSEWFRIYPERVVEKDYFRASGTSMSAPMVSGAAALLLQDEPQLTPDQVKYRLLNTARTIPGEMGDQQGYPYPYLDVYAAVTGTSTASANTGLEASQLLWSGSEPVQWSSVNWGSVNWGSVNWGSVNWGSVNWGSVNWGSVNWGN